jgi:hypothetical protein
VRWKAALALALTVAAGLSVRPVTGGAFGKYAGDALYATAVYWCVVLVRPAWPIRRTGLVAVAICWAIELFQLTPIPRELSADSTVSRLVLGSTFGGWDLAAYAVGGLLAAAVHAALRGRRVSRG